MAHRSQSRKMSFVLSVLGHGAIVLALTFSLPLSGNKHTVTPSSEVIPIESVMIDESVVQAAIDRNEAENLEAERQRQEDADRVRREQEDAERQLAEQQAAADRARIEREQAEAELAEQQRAAEQERIRLQQQAEAEAEAILIAQREEEERQARLEAERKAAEEAAAEAERQRREEQERLAAEEAERQRREEEERRQREEAERQARLAAEAEQRRRDEIARQVAMAAAAEAEANAARDAGLQDQWLAAIENKVTRYWRRPPTAEVGLECVLIVNLIPSGDVTSVQVVPSECNADAVTIRSIENAINEASPLPQPPVPSVFERVIRFRFKPDA